MKNIKKNQGFTLIEMTIVVIIGALILAAVLALAKPEFARMQRQKTLDAMSTIELALANYRLRNNDTYPCPAPIDANRGTAEDGRGIPDCHLLTTTDTVPGVTIVPGRDNRPVLIGGVPYRALGIPVSATIDTYNNRISYAVSALSTDASTFDDGSDLLLHSGAIDVVDRSDTTLLGDTGTAHFFYFSHGIDGKGAITDAATPTSAACTGGLDAENCNGDFRFRSDEYARGSTAVYFDDVDSYALKIQADQQQLGWWEETTSGSGIIRNRNAAGAQRVIITEQSDLNVGNNLSVSGTTNLDGILDVDGATALNNGVNVSGNASISGELDMNSNDVSNVNDLSASAVKTTRYVQTGSISGNCTSTLKGAMRINGTDMEYCDGTGPSWKPFTSTVTLNIPDCASAGQVLTSNGTNFSCVDGGTGNPGSVDGACGTNRPTCVAGTPSTAGMPSNQWRCLGVDGGADVTCTEQGGGNPGVCNNGAPWLGCSNGTAVNPGYVHNGNPYNPGIHCTWQCQGDPGTTLASCQSNVQTTYIICCSNPGAQPC